MVLYVAIISTLNLCMGYALGVYVGKMPALPRLAIRLPKRRKRAASDIAPEQPEPEVAAEIVEVPPTEEHVDIDDFAKGLADFQSQLNDLDEKLHSGEADEETLGQCADQLEHASDNYLQRANEACEQLEPSADDSEQIVEEKLQVKQSILEQSEIVKDQRTNCSELDTSDTDTATKELLDSSQALAGAADTLQDQLSNIFAASETAEETLPDEEVSGTDVLETDASETDASENDVAETDVSETDEEAAESVATSTHAIDRDAARQQLDEFYKTDEEDNQLIAAIVELDSMDRTRGEVVERLFAALTELVDAELVDQHATAEYAEGQLLLLLGGETIDSATLVVEQVRQRIDTLQFSADGEKCEASVSCALIDARHAVNRTSLESQLAEALGEARRYGSNKTFCHDGTEAGPVVPPELALASEERAI